MLEYEFERLETEYGTGYSFFGGIKGSTGGHRAIILRRAAEGWRFVAALPVTQRAEGYVEVFDLIFEREV